MEYYVQEINEMDSIILDLINKVNELGEPTIIAFMVITCLVLNITNDRLSNGTIYDTPLLIWDNLGLDKDSLSLKSYQLSSYLLDKLHLQGGIVSSLHQLKSEDDNYLDSLHAIQYDILYGKNILMKRKSYSKTNMLFGFKEQG